MALASWGRSLDVHLSAENRHLSLSVMPKQSPLQRPEAFAKSLGAWFAANAKDYPWRRTTDPYAILVSEMMLQQTQIPTVLGRGYYARWMERFPDVLTLAAAAEADVLRTWEGLGYYRRARFLQQMARTVKERHNGVFPGTLEEIHALPGVGRYTAGAVMSFAYDKAAPIVDGNVARVLARLFNDPTPVDSTEGQVKLWERAESLVQAAPSARAHNSALMELGQTVCRVSSPACQHCPVQKYCLAEDPASLPVKGARAAATEVTERVFFHRTDEGVLLQQETGARRTGLWKLPALPECEKLPGVLHKSRYTITRYRVTLWVHDVPPMKKRAALGENQSIQLISHDDLANLPMPSPYRRALNALLADKTFRLEA
jgi:A/G-specific adenine glycosylase